MLKVTHGNQIWLIAQIPERYCYAPAIYNRDNNLNRIKQVPIGIKLKNLFVGVQGNQFVSNT